MVRTDHCCPPENTQVEFQTERKRSESMVQAIVRALSTTKDVPVTELDSLYESINTEAVNSLFGHAETRHTAICLEFTHQDHTVTVTQSGAIYVRSSDDEYG
ncbi:hypothetical protein AArc1_2854 [Natrarchaeobaculum sulfurireducens]|uniref:Halobacterial output domain-containing protein n=2 Tax=Natrarchaeobaculum sulfurireducens TaxID=2044521 RepID=A0A346PI21_9EURY|nr:hypothetical protein AArc1_2854 [Natrarchaeobaculum sulfurireducens]